MSEIRNQELEQDGIKYYLDESKNACNVIGTTKDIDEVFIPYSIKRGASQYLVMTISSTAFSHKKIKSIQFESDSKLETIDEKAFGRILRAS